AGVVEEARDGAAGRVGRPRGGPGGRDPDAGVRGRLEVRGQFARGGAADLAVGEPGGVALRLARRDAVVAGHEERGGAVHGAREAGGGEAVATGGVEILIKFGDTISDVGLPAKVRDCVPVIDRY